MRHYGIAIGLFSACSVSWASPFLIANPYPSTGTQPTSAEFTINGGTPKACTIETVSAGKQPKCDLASITAAGDYTLIMTVKAGATVLSQTKARVKSRAAEPRATYTCTNEPNAATCSVGSGVASSAPFTYKLRTNSVSAPGSLQVVQ